MYSDIIESLEDCIKICQCNEKYLLKRYLESINYKGNTKYLDKLNYWLVYDEYVNYLFNNNIKDFINIFKTFKEKLPINEKNNIYSLL